MRVETNIDRKLKESFDRLVIVSNRLPFQIVNDENGVSLHPANGGLVTAMLPILQRTSGVWIGWDGTFTEDKIDSLEVIEQFSVANGVRMKNVSLTGEEHDGFYLGFSNQVIWPLFHDFLDKCQFEQRFWDVYLQANERFCEVACNEIKEDDFVWVHDYHLIPLGKKLRERGYEGTLNFFLHIPFPSPDMFMRLPWRSELLESMFAFDVIGFQTKRDYKNFVDCVDTIYPNCLVEASHHHCDLNFRGKMVRAQYFPISIDTRALIRMAKAKTTAKEADSFRAQNMGQKLLLGVDRADYTKGIVQRLCAFETCLSKYPDLVGKITLMQVVVPSRTGVPEYQRWLTEMEQAVGRISGKHSIIGWNPIKYFYRSIPLPELVALYHASDIALVTPTKDGMNLVCKEYCSCGPSDGVLILSEFAGAASELKKGAILVNPYDYEGVADAIYKAFTMEVEEKKRRMTKMIDHLKRYDVYRWGAEFIEASLSIRKTVTAG